MNPLVVYLLALVILVALELLYFRIADRCNIVDKPELRSSHTRVTLRGGGIVFLMAAWLWAAFFGLQYPWFMAGLTVVACVSFVDDISSVSNEVRLVAQFMAVFLLLLEPGLLPGLYWWVPIVAVVCVGILNAYNFMDGINGITGGYSLAVLLPLLAVNHREVFIDQHLLVIILISVLIFCFFNFRKRARCFAGDVGAVSIAFILVYAIARLIRQTGDFSWLMLLAVYGVDSVLTIVHRILLREHLGQAHRKHAYQIMANELAIPHVVVSLIYAGLQLIVSAGLLFLPVNRYLYAGIILTLLAVGYIVFMKKYFYLHKF